MFSSGKPNIFLVSITLSPNLTKKPNFFIYLIKKSAVKNSQNKKVNIPSIIVRAGDEVKVRDNFKGSAKFKSLSEGLQTKTAPKWLSVDKAACVAKVVALPAREDIDFEFNEQLIVELYSK